MKKLFKSILIPALVILFPIFVFAQGVLPSTQNAPNYTTYMPGNTSSSGLADVITRISDLFGAILPVLVALGVIYFVWGVVQYFIADSDEAKTKGRDRIIYGIIGLAVIVSVWGLVTLLGTTLGIDKSGAPVSDIAQLAPKAGPACPDLKSINQPKFSDYLDYVTCTIGNSVIPFLFAVAVVMFIWGAIKFFIIDSDEEAKRAQGKQFMIWGIIALAVMLSVWGLVGILKSTFNINTGSSVLPTVRP